MAELSKIKRQLSSIRSTQKLTNAMSLVSQAKLLQQRRRLQENTTYAQQYEIMLKTALSVPVEKETNPYLVASKVNNPLHIVIASNSGLCGSYNSDLLKFVEQNVSREEPIFAIGNKAITYLMNNDFMVIKQFHDSDDLRPSVINKLISDVMTLYQNDEISSIDIVYTKYINSLKYEPVIKQILPFTGEYEVDPETDLSLEPNRDNILNNLIPSYVSAVIYEAILEAQTSEHAARRSAMDSANNNAKDLISSLEKTYNQIRQTAITQEVNEITAGYDVS
ncbi:MAG: ATP synthase F1 subunit gamma [Erysipelotrichaceae bacterium]|nr:ATP synthase F1 subunit gamma [Erysipelotrichaceae bacterium]